MVTRVWGKADSFDLVFSPLGDGLWNANVPIDLEDGQYIVELYCEDQGGSRAYWTGILYLNNSEQVRVRIIADKFKVWLDNDEIETKLEGEHHIWMHDDLEIKVSYIDFVSGG